MKTIGIEYNYETQKGIMTYIPSDLPKFAEANPVSVEFEINDENILEAHEFMTSAVVKQASKDATDQQY